MDATTTVDVGCDLVIDILLSGLSYYYAAVETATLVSLTTDVVAVIVAIAVFGLFFFSSSAVADVAEMADASRFNEHKKATDYPSLFSFLL